MTCEQLLENVPQFNKFYGALTSCFGTDNVSCRKISAFGKHKKSDTTMADENAESEGISEMLSEIVPDFENNRVQSFFSRYEAVGDKPFYIRYAQVPVLFLESLKMSLQGIADAEKREKNFGILRRSGRRFATECFCFFAFILGSLVVSNMRLQEKQYEEIDSRIAKGFVSANDISVTEKDIGGEPRMSFANWNALILKNRRAGLLKEISNAKDDFNESIFNKFITEYTNRVDNITNIVKTAATERSNHINILKDEAEKAMTNLTEDASQREDIKKIVEFLDKGVKDNKYYSEFDNEYHTWSKIDNHIDKANKAHEFLEKYDNGNYTERKNLIDEVRNRKFNIEEVEFGKLTNNLHQAKYSDDYSGKTDGYTNRISRCNERIVLIDTFMARLPHSAFDDECKKLNNAENNRIDFLQDYGPFDEDSYKLNSEAENFAKSAEAFLEKYEGKCPDREFNRQKLKSDIRIFESNKVQEVVACISEVKLADSTNLLWRVRLERSDDRTNKVTQCLAHLSSKSEYAEQLNAQLKKDIGIKAGIERLRKYYEEYDNVDGQEKEYKIKAINKFLKEYGTDQYNDVPARYSQKHFEDEKKRLIEYFDKTLANAEKIKDDAKSKGWTERLEAVKALQEELNRYTISTGTDKKQEMTEVAKQISLCEKNIDFDNAIAGIRIKADHANDKDLFDEIHAFKMSFPESEWGYTRKSDYDSVCVIESNRIAKLQCILRSGFDRYNEWAPVSNAIKSCRGRIGLLEAYRDELHPSMDEYSSAERKLSMEKSRLEDLNTAKIAFDEIIHLKEEGKNLKGKDETEITTFLYRVFELSRKYSALKNDELIGASYQEIIAIRDEFDSDFERKMRKELVPHDETLKDSELQDDEKIREEKARIGIFKSYLSKFCPDGIVYKKVMSEYAKAIDGKDGFEKLHELTDKLKVLNEELDNRAISAREKGEKIDAFISDFRSQGGEDRFPEFGNSVRDLNSRKDELNRDADFDELCAKITKVFSDFSEDKQEKDLAGFQKKAQDYIAELGQFVSYPSTSGKARSKQADCDAIIKRADLRLKIRKHWNALLSAGNEYLLMPINDKYNKYRSALNDYKRIAPDRTRECDNLERRCTELRDAQIDMEKYYASFRKEPGRFSLFNLIKTVNRHNSLSVTPVGLFAKECERWAEYGRNINVELKGYNFRGEFKAHRVVFHAELYIGAYKCEFNKGGNWSDNRLCPKSLASVGFTPQDCIRIVPVVLSQKLDVKVRFENRILICVKSNQVERSFYEILARAAEHKGEADFTFWAKSESGDSKEHDSSVTFNFSELPYVK